MAACECRLADHQHAVPCGVALRLASRGGEGEGGWEAHHMVPEGTAGLASWTTAPLCVGHARVRPGDVKLFLRDLFGDFPISQKKVGFGLIALLSITVTFFGLVAAAVLLMS